MNVGIKAAHRYECGRGRASQHITGIKPPPTERQRNYGKTSKGKQDLLTGRLLAATTRRPEEACDCPDMAETKTEKAVCQGCP